jgi:hypothetical protein
MRLGIPQTVGQRGEGRYLLPLPEFEPQVFALSALYVLTELYRLPSTMATIGSQLTARYWLLVAVLTVQFVLHRKHTPYP